MRESQNHRLWRLFWKQLCPQPDKPIFGSLRLTEYLYNLTGRIALHFHKRECARCAMARPKPVHPITASVHRARRAVKLVAEQTEARVRAECAAELAALRLKGDALAKAGADMDKNIADYTSREAWRAALAAWNAPAPECPTCPARAGGGKGRR